MGVVGVIVISSQLRALATSVDVRMTYGNDDGYYVPPQRRSIFPRKIGGTIEDALPAEQGSARPFHTDRCSPPPPGTGGVDTRTVTGASLGRRGLGRRRVFGRGGGL